MYYSDLVEIQADIDNGSTDEQIVQSFRDDNRADFDEQEVIDAIGSCRESNN